MQNDDIIEVYQEQTGGYAINSSCPNDDELTSMDQLVDAVINLLILDCVNRHNNQIKHPSVSVVTERGRF